ncbi:helix-turn-helix domain-containing protein [Nocardia sp. NPDC060256]|uniref:helix-turn-helix domain-containing protein n=1 Tax=unclassified Nocardia TaxID=2637762 RepID=UPI003647F660
MCRSANSRQHALSGGSDGSALVELLTRDLELVPREAGSPVLRAVVYMQDQMGRTVTLAELAGVARFSPYHFLRMFKRATGHTPHRYLTLLRIAEVKRLLERGVTVVRAAQLCGFYSAAHLSAVFVRETGVRPSRWQPSAKPARL